jgi:hypothetical protein
MIDDARRGTNGGNFFSWEFLMLNLKNKADLERLVSDEIQESLTLDYKASPALAKDSKARDELCKDVSALANSAGGQLVYGIEEKDHKPIRVDEGNTSVTREWIEQVLGSNVQPRILGLVITPIQLSKGFSYVISVPQSVSRGAHQSPDKKYYKRQNFQSTAMDDYEIRDVMKRATTPDLFVSLSFLEGNRHHVEFVPNDDTSKPFNLIAKIINRSVQPAYHAIVDIGLVTDLRIISRGGYQRFDVSDNGLGTPMNWFRWSHASPPGLPIFKEHLALLSDNVLMLAIHPQELGIHGIFDITVITSTPGFSSTEHWAIQYRGGTLVLHAPGSEFAAKRPVN